MNCPLCRKDTVVLETRGLDRRRHCRDGCGHRFTTIEVLKEDHQRQAKLLKDAQELAGALIAEG